MLWSEPRLSTRIAPGFGVVHVDLLTCFRPHGCRHFHYISAAEPDRHCPKRDLLHIIRRVEEGDRILKQCALHALWLRPIVFSRRRGAKGQRVQAGRAVLEPAEGAGCEAWAPSPRSLHRQGVLFVSPGHRELA